MQTYHSASYALLSKTVATIRQPWLGGFEYIGRTISLSWLRTATACSRDLQTTVRLPARSSANWKGKEQSCHINVTLSRGKGRILQKPRHHSRTKGKHVHSQNEDRVIESSLCHLHICYFTVKCKLP